MSKINKHNQNQFILIDPIPMQSYFQFINDSNFKISIVPLADTKFNKSKSNIAYQEAAFANAAALCPDWEEWQRPGVTRYKDQETFYHGLKKLIIDNDYCEQKTIEAWDYVKNHECLPVINLKREAILKEIFS